MSGLRVFFLGVDDPIYYVPFLDRVAAGIPNQLVGVGAVDFASRPGGRTRRAREMVRAWGPLVVARLALLQIARRRGLWDGVGGMADLAKRHGVPFFGRAADCNGPDVRQWLATAQPDVVVATVTQRVRAETLRAVPRGFINTHHGLLPRHAGRNAPFWALLEGDAELGTTLHLMDERIDTGPVLAQIRTSPRPHESLHALLERLFETAAPVLAGLLREPEWKPMALPAGAAQMQPAPARADVRRFRARGHSYF